MELINTTCADFALDVTSVDRFPTQKAARLVAKLTFDVAADGALHLVAEDPLPVLRSDVVAPSGIVPADTSGFAHDSIEVIVNGAAHAPSTKPVPQAEVSFAIGSTLHRAMVTGDRVWVGRGE